MALSFAKKGAALAQPAAQPTSQPAPATQVSHAKPANVVETVGKVSWLKTGQAAKQAQAAEAMKAEERAAQAGKLFRFFLGPGEEARITFLDGKLDEGILDCSSFDEHMVRLNGEWVNYICTSGHPEETEACPLCSKGDKAKWVGLYTIIDHRAYKVKNGPNAGKIYQHTRKLYMPKWDTNRVLTTIAEKTGANGLAGCTFDVTRTGEKKAAVGDSFFFIEKHTSLASIADKYNLQLEDVQPANYEEEFTYRSSAELIALGVDKAITGGAKKGASGGSVSNLKNEL